ncbi:MAG: UbiA family prenyltransferase [Desulfuromonadales bacterium]|nr:UbiA family prenyltransferase [Desulfuromonadales bacterium]
MSQSVPIAVETGERGEAAVPLVVDLDGTLVKSDLLMESFLLLIKANPLHVFLALVWWCRGKAYLKAEIARRVDLDVSHLPYNQIFVDFLKLEAATGRPVILATGADIRLARRVADYFGFFHQVLASDGRSNLTGESKLKVLIEACVGGFDYAGNATADLPVCRRARQVILVNAGRRLIWSMRASTNLHRVFDDRRPGTLPWLRAMRPHQWLKNLLLFVPLLTAHLWHQPPKLLAAGIAFLAFSLAASAIYLVNDLLDLGSDRLHPQKRHRPFAAGEVPIAPGVLFSTLLLGTAIALSTRLPPLYSAVLLVYVAVAFAYSLYLKRVVIIDVITLAGLYSIRVVAGAVAIDVSPSFWLLSFSMFIFFSLALVKRYAELRGLRQGRASARGRDYRRADQGIIYSMGTASGFLSILVLALFIRSPELASDYRRPEILWLLCPVLLYWVGRIWVKAGRGEVHEDPLLFAARDRGSRLVFLLCLVIIMSAQ